MSLLASELISEDAANSSTKMLGLAQTNAKDCFTVAYVISALLDEALLYKLDCRFEVKTG